MVVNTSLLSSGTGSVIALQSGLAIAQPKLSDYLFKLGVASGDPLPDDIVVWTRLAPESLNGGGMPQQNISVRWQVAMDAKMRQVVKN